ncbi:hypothetical protein CAEBREN_06471 [Caenorhabditis brenneri]|uniref:RING-type domain-containing protein n=1 Tax=Caenorhabditis brenneri TaxID=135651 RepID=G0NDC2_CAEBE|nr:hypothetical protein CAEBREN_06471 [Caenorhabditis brenneri]
MARPSLRSDSSQGVGTSSGRKKKEKKKPTIAQKTTRKTAPRKPAPKSPKSARPRVKYTAADVRRMKKELEDLIEETEAEKDKNNMLVEEQTKELFELKRTEETQKEEDFDAGLKFLTEEAKECKKRMEIDKQSKKCEATTCLQKYLDQSRGLSAHFQSRFEALEADGGPAQSYKKCELCNAQWSQIGDSVPRILDCGHTMCDKCTQKFVIPGGRVRCPFDKKKSYGQGTIPKNYTLLNIQ